MNKRKFDETIGVENISKQTKVLHHNICLVDNVLKYDLMTSLENIATSKVAVALWMNQNTQEQIMHIFHTRIRQDKFGCDWQRVKRNIVTKLSELLLPNYAIDKLTSVSSIVANSIYRWIRYHDEYILNSGKSANYSAVDFYSSITWTNRGNIDYARTAKNILARHDCELNDDHKYKLACSFCLEDEIAVLATKFVGPYYLNRVKIEAYPMVHYWTAAVCTGVRNLNLNKNVLKLLMNDDYMVNNEVAMIYMWNTLENEEKTKHIIPLIQKIVDKDLKFSFVSSLSYEMQQVVFIECSDIILCDMLNDWLWVECFLPTALHVLNIMDPLSYFYTLNAVKGEIVKNLHNDNKKVYNQHKSIFNQLWQDCPRQLKHDFFKYENGSLLLGLVFSFFRERDVDILELLFNDFPTEQKKELIFGNNGMEYCSFLIQNHQWDLLEIFIKHTLSSEGEVIQLKKSLMEYTGIELAESLLEQGLEEIESFMNWVFDSEKEIDEFRRSLAYVNIEGKLKWIIESDEVDFTELENHFKWCAKGDLEVINELKSEIPEICYGLETLRFIFEEQQHGILDRVWNWCFLNDPEQIETFKNNYMLHQ